MLGIVLKYLPLLQVAAVVVASGILSIGISRELFETERYTITPPGLDPVDVTRLKYTTRRAAVARDNFRFLTDAIYVLLTTLLLALFISIGTEALILALKFWGNSGKAAGETCFVGGFYKFLFCEFSTVARDAAEQTRRGVENEMSFPVGAIMFWLLLFGGVLIVGLGMAVRTVVNIRADHV
jgi:uncharacterized membrane protein YccF (DUF307 family)